MCGRYTLSLSKRSELKAADLQVVDRFNIAPQSDVVVYNNDRQIQQMRWDYSPPWAQKPLHLSNARSETLREKPAFRGALRCVFLADGWYEWRQQGKGKTPYYHHANGELLYFAGIYNQQSGCAIVTRDARENIAFVHHRQPVLLESRAVDPWLEGHDLFASATTQRIECHPVSIAVNKPSNDYADLVTPVELPRSANKPVAYSAKPGRVRSADKPQQLSIQKDLPVRLTATIPAAAKSTVPDKTTDFSDALKPGQSGDLFD